MGLAFNLKTFEDWFMIYINLKLWFVLRNQTRSVYFLYVDISARSCLYQLKFLECERIKTKICSKIGFISTITNVSQKSFRNAFQAITIQAMATHYFWVWYFNYRMAIYSKIIIFYWKIYFYPFLCINHINKMTLNGLEALTCLKYQGRVINDGMRRFTECCTVKVGRNWIVRFIKSETI